MEESQQPIHWPLESSADAQAASTTGAPPSQAEQHFGQRLECIDAHRADRPDCTRARRAALRAVATGLMEVEARVAVSIQQSLLLEDFTAETIERYSHPIDLQIRLCKQIVQIEQIDMRLAQQDSAEAADRPRH
jgi:hypothetical protein